MLMKRMRALWQSLFGDADRRVRLGRIVGFAFMTAGVVMIGLAWNGAASRNFVEGQFPYLLSGGVMGLALVIIGATLLFLATIRAERELMTNRFDEMITLLGRNLNRLSISSNGSAGLHGQVVAGDTVFHRAECRVLQGKEGLATVTVEQAEAEGLAPCRVCEPPHTEPAAEPVSSGEGATAQPQEADVRQEPQPAVEDAAVMASSPGANGGSSSGSETPGR